jgi:hypothetical protein
MSTQLPLQMTSETLNALKGWPQPAAVDYNAQFDASVVTRVAPGACVHVSASGTFILGVGNLKVMPLFTFQASDANDVSNYGGDPTSEKGVWIPISPTGEVMALVGVGAYELVSTNIPSGQTYNVNDHLTSPLVGANAGKLVVGTIYTDTVVGLVSRPGPSDNGYGFDSVAFWPQYIPSSP